MEICRALHIIFVLKLYICISKNILLRTIYVLCVVSNLSFEHVVHVFGMRVKLVNVCSTFTMMPDTQ